MIKKWQFSKQQLEAKIVAGKMVIRYCKQHVKGRGPAGDIISSDPLLKQDHA